MSDIKFAHVKLESIIDFDNCKSNGSSFTKTFINANKGDIPVYGASSDEQEVSYGYVKDNLFIADKSGKQTPVRYFENCLTWNIDGSIAIFLRKGRFSLSEKVIPLIVFQELEPFIDLDYLRFCISQSNELSNFGFSNKAGKSRLKEIQISIPIRDDGEYDIEEQKNIAERYRKIEEQKDALLSYVNTLKTTLINANFASQYNHKEADLTELFTPQRGNSKYTKTYCFNNIGEYPVFSANNNEPLAYANFFDYDGCYLTVSVNGIAGRITKKEGKFSINADRVILVPLVENLDLDYIKFTVEPILRSKIKGRMGHDGQNEFTKLPSGTIEKVKISIPIKEDGNFDLEAQREISNKYRKIQQINDAICQQIEELVNIKIAL